MSWLHTWAGLLVGWILFFMCLTGTLGYAAAEIDRWMKPEAPLRPMMPSAADMAAVAETRLRAVALGADSWTIGFPGRRQSSGWSNDLSIDWTPGAQEIIDLRTGRAIPPSERAQVRETAGGRTLYRMHYQFAYLPAPSVTDWLAGICAMFMLVACVTGVIVHKKIFTDFFTVRPRTGQRSWLDVHNLLAVTALPFHLMIAYSGLVFGAYVYVSPILDAHGMGDVAREVLVDEMFETSLITKAAPHPEAEPAGVAAPLTPLSPLVAGAARQWGDRPIERVVVHHPGDANARVYVKVHPDTSVARQAEGLLFDGVSGALLRYDGVPPRSVPKAIADVSMSVHEGLFAGPVLRWLYFLSGVLATSMVGTGLVMWTVKRRRKLERRANATHRGLVLVERLNVGTIVGLPTAIAVYFWANRLIPAAMHGRAAWEVHSMFIAWALLLLHAALRPGAAAWLEQCWLAATAYVLLPVLNALTTDRHLGTTIPAGDWPLASVDLCMLGTGLCFAFVGPLRSARWRRTAVVEIGGDQPTSVRAASQREHEAAAGANRRRIPVAADDVGDVAGR